MSSRSRTRRPTRKTGARPARKTGARRSAKGSARRLGRAGRRTLGKALRRAWRRLSWSDRLWIGAFCGTLIGLLVWSASLEPSLPAGDICEIFERRPAWYRDTARVAEQYGVGQALQMAVVRHEAGFQARARPPRRRIWGFIPGPRPSTAFGYSQALDGTWQRFQHETRRPRARRDRFSDAVELIGWYYAETFDRLGPKARDPYHFYLAYNQGVGGYVKAVERPDSPAARYARRVAATASRFETRLEGCRPRLERRKWAFLGLEILLLAGAVGLAGWYVQRHSTTRKRRRP